MFRFRVMHHSIVALKGEASRQAFYGNKSLSFSEGYKILVGNTPRLIEVIDITDAVDEDDTAAFNKCLLPLLRKDRLQTMLPQLLGDINCRMLLWGKECRIDPFKQIHELVFQMTVRMATCSELAEDQDAVNNLSANYWKIEKSATPVALLLPWFPGPAKRARQEALMALYGTISHFVDLRKRAGASSADAIDLLIREGGHNVDIHDFIMRVIFAGTVNTGIISCWVMIHLASHPEWKAKVASELTKLASEHAPNSAEPIHQRLSSIHISAWEDQMPAMELVIRETMRMALSGTALRRNIHEDIEVDGKIIKRGDFLAYSLADVHLNPEIYTDPHQFDPSRFEVGREEDMKGTWAFLGWGAGRHPCSGMKAAKLEIKVIVAMFLAAYEFDLVDETGSFPKSLPQPNRNDIHQARPLGKPCYLEFKRVTE